MAWQVYRRNDGRAARWASVAVLVALGIYGAWSWYIWRSDSMFFGLNIGTHPVSVGDVGAAAIFLGMLISSCWFCFVNPKVSNFLIEVEMELRKVTWPSPKPWFSTRSEVWTSTYVVLAVMAILTIFVAAADWILGLAWLHVFVG